MAIQSKEEIMASVKELLGESTDDNALAFMENISDTLDDLTTKAADTTNWKDKYETNDKEWREKYRDRFLSSVPNTEDEQRDTDIITEPIPQKTKFEDLFD